MRSIPISAAPLARRQAARRRDLRKLSEWIKMMRELEERKALEQNAEQEPTEE